MKIELVEKFTLNNRICAITKATFSILFSWHNGYIELLDGEVKDSYNDYPNVAENLTYQGHGNYFNNDETKTFIGFDTNHYYNRRNPSSQTPQAVLYTILQTIKELENAQPR